MSDGQTQVRIIVNRFNISGGLLMDCRMDTLTVLLFFDKCMFKFGMKERERERKEEKKKGKKRNCDRKDEF